MTKAVPFLIQGKNIILVVDGKSHTVSKDTHISYNKIVDALKSQDWDALRDLVEPKKAIVNFGKGYVSIEDNIVYWKGLPFHNALSSRMIEMYLDGFPIDPMVRFMENLLSNPSKRSVDQVYSFLEKNKLPITEDGYFLAYKKVRDDYKSIHCGTDGVHLDNSVGTTVEMERNLVDDNPDSYCSTGLHFCSLDYLDDVGGINQPVMILKINPADVVSIPKDYNGAKGRCCKYLVIAEVNGDPARAFSGIVDQAYAKPAEKVTPVAQWPFATGSSDVVHNTIEELDEESDEELYDLQRVNGGWVEYYGLTLDEAKDRVAKQIRQKKAQLKIVKAGTDEEIE